MTDLSEGTKQCLNCQQKINLANFLIHESFCLRNIQLCELCRKPVNKNQKDEHFEQFHAKIKCECGEEIEKINLEAHKEETCKKRKANCIYCDLTLDFDKIQEHIDFCGSRTEKCTKCNQYIQFKDKNKHDSTNCAYPPSQPQSKPKLQQTTQTNSYLPRYQSLQPPYYYNLNPQMNSAQKTNQNESDEDDVSFSLLPCEFCTEYFPSSELIDHQNSCELNPIFSEEAIVPDPINPLLNNFENLNINNPIQLMNRLTRDPFSVHREMLQNTFGRNTFGTTRNPIFSNNQNEDLSYMNYLTEDEDYDNQNETNNSAKKQDQEIEKVPCELCEELIDFDDYQVHQLTCKYSEEVLAASRASIDPIISQYDTNKPDNKKSEYQNLQNNLYEDNMKRNEIPTSSKSILKSTKLTPTSTTMTIKPAIKPTINSLTNISSNSNTPSSSIKKSEPFKPTTRHAGFSSSLEKSNEPKTSSSSSTASSSNSSSIRPSLTSNKTKTNGLPKPR